MTRWSLFLQTLSLLHHFLGLYSATILEQPGLSVNVSVVLPTALDTLKPGTTMCDRSWVDSTNLAVEHMATAAGPVCGKGQSLTGDQYRGIARGTLEEAVLLGYTNLAASRGMGLGGYPPGTTDPASSFR